jgi:hypothetical protein
MCDASSTYTAVAMLIYMAVAISELDRAYVVAPERSDQHFHLRYEWSDPSDIGQWYECGRLSRTYEK